MYDVASLSDTAALVAQLLTIELFVPRPTVKSEPVLLNIVNCVPLVALVGNVTAPPVT